MILYTRTVYVSIRAKFQYLCLQCHGARGYSSVVEHSTADREVPGSNPGVPSCFAMCFATKGHSIFLRECLDCHQGPARG